jgi:hypothetical protein
MRGIEVVALGFVREVEAGANDADASNRAGPQHAIREQRLECMIDGEIRADRGVGRQSMRAEERRARGQLGTAPRRLNRPRVLAHLAVDAGHERTEIDSRLLASAGGRRIDAVANHEVAHEDQPLVRAWCCERGGQIVNASAHALGGALATANLRAVVQGARQLGECCAEQKEVDGRVLITTVEAGADLAIKSRDPRTPRRFELALRNSGKVRGVEWP